MTNNTSEIGFEKQIWDAADVLRGNMDAAEYKHVVLGLIFLKYISDKFEDQYKKLVKEGDGFEEEGRSYLPNMRTDIVLETEDKQLIIDTKFYKKILSSFHEKFMLHSPNLYQIYTYVNNSVFEGEIMGMLLYASLGEDIDYQFKIGGNLILIKTIDLNQSWDGINGRLKEIGNLIL